MVNSALDQYQITDLLDWNSSGRLTINRDFQRGNVWSNEARVYLIDTILRKMPIPKFYMRQLVDLETRQSIREIVDGQQRIGAILDFADDKLVLTKRAGEFAGQRYSTLDPDLKEVFLSYPVAVEHLINASVDDVLEVFSRLNSYTVRLNAQELRHAQFQGEFKWNVRAAVQKWTILWDKLQVVSRKDRVRMLDDELMAQLFGILIDGVKDGGQNYIERLYSKYNNEFPDALTVNESLDEVLEFICSIFITELEQSPIRNAPHFLMFFASVAHQLRGIPVGDIGDLMPQRQDGALSDIAIASNNLRALATVLEMPESDAQSMSKKMFGFWTASRRTTQRIKSRQPRFRVYCEALQPIEISYVS